MKNIERLVFRRNRQVGLVLMLVAIFVGVILFLDVYDVDLGFYLTLQWLVLIVLLILAILEFTVPFAVIRRGKIIIREFVFYRTTIKINNISDISLQNRKIEILLQNNIKIKLMLRYLHHNDKRRFVSSLENLITYST